MNIEKIRGIFVEEAQEIIAKLENDIIDLEQSPGDQGIINELFRGVHTLKGNAKSFGFENLGHFAHTLEDLLDRYRSGALEVPKEAIEICLRGIDILKELVERETQHDSSLPGEYESILESIKTFLGTQTAKASKPAEGGNDLAKEFAEVMPPEVPAIKVGVASLVAGMHAAEVLYQIAVTLPAGPLSGISYDRVAEAVSKTGTICRSEWDLRDVPAIETFDPEQNYIPRVIFFLQSTASRDSIAKALSFVEEKNRSISLIGHTGDTQPGEVGKKADTGKTAVAKVGGSQIKIDTEKLDILFNTIGELVIAQNFLADNEAIRTLENENITRAIESLSKITKELHKQVMTLRMVPVQMTFEKMKRVVHDAAKGLDKTVELILEGVDTEVDKTMIDALADPLVHMVRNAVDHGVESAQRRLAAGKSVQGSIRLNAFHRGGSIVIEVSDDGAGIDKETVRAQAIARGLIDKHSTPGDEELFALLLLPGFSTAESLSEISGRGVGLDVVNTAINKLHGSIEIRSVPKKGSTFSLILPLTLAIIDGMVVKNDEALFIIPTLSVLETFTADPSMIHTIRGEEKFVDLRGTMIPIVTLGRLLNIEPSVAAKKRHEYLPIYILVVSTTQEYVIEVEEIINRQQIVIKPLGHPLDNIREFAGGAILGSGEIAFILDIGKLYGAER